MKENAPLKSRNREKYADGRSLSVYRPLIENGEVIFNASLSDERRWNIFESKKKMLREMANIKRFYESE